MIINIVSPHASVYLGGMEIVTINMALHLARLGVTVRFFTRQPKVTRSDAYEQLLATKPSTLSVIEVSLSDHTPLPDSSWPTFYRISCDFGVAAQPLYDRYSDADLFITHLSVDSLFIPPTSRTVLHLHGSPYHPDPLMTAAVQSPVATIAHSESIRAWWTDHFPDLHPTLFLNGIDITRYNGDSLAERPIDVLYVGRYLEHKGAGDILHALQPDQIAVLAGNGPYLSELKSIATARNLTRVTFYDTPSSDTIAQLYKQAKIFACPSRAKEGLLTTLLEAGASGCAVITASGSGMTDLVIDKQNGLVVEPANILQLQSAIAQLLKNQSERTTLAAQLQTDIQRGWSWEQRAKDLKEIYENATK